MPFIVTKFILTSVVLAAAAAAVAGTVRTENQKTWVYDYRSHPTISAYDLLSGGRDQNRLTEELEKNHYGVQLVLIGHDNPSGMTAFQRDTSHVVPGKVTVRLVDGSRIDADLVMNEHPAAVIIPGSAVDSHGNQLPSRWDQIAKAPLGNIYNFSGPGDPGDQKNFEKFVKLFGVKFTGQGRYERCQSAADKSITCHRSNREI